jgi:hypothetical protein
MQTKSPRRVYWDSSLAIIAIVGLSKHLGFDKQWQKCKQPDYLKEDSENLIAYWKRGDDYIYIRYDFNDAWMRYRIENRKQLEYFKPRKPFVSTPQERLAEKKRTLEKQAARDKEQAQHRVDALVHLMAGHNDTTL